MFVLKTISYNITWRYYFYDLYLLFSPHYICCYVCNQEPIEPLSFILNGLLNVCRSRHFYEGWSHMSTLHVQVYHMTTLYCRLKFWLTDHQSDNNGWHTCIHTCISIPVAQTCQLHILLLYLSMYWCYKNCGQ